MNLAITDNAIALNDLYPQAPAASCVQIQQQVTY